jgi:hypothetical protein
MVYPLLFGCQSLRSAAVSWGDAHFGNGERARDRRVLRQRIHRVSHLAGVARYPRQFGNLPVGSDPSPGDPADDRVDALVRRIGNRQLFRPE